MKNNTLGRYPWIALGLLALIAGVLGWEHQAQKAELAELRKENREIYRLRLEREELEKYKARLAELVRIQEATKDVETLQQELASLRLENKQLREDLVELQGEGEKATLNRLMKENQTLKQQLQQVSESAQYTDLQFQITESHLEDIGSALHRFAERYNGRLPRNITDLKRFAPDTLNSIDPASYEIVHRATRLDQVENPAETPWIVQKEPDANGNRAIVYFDGRVEILESVPPPGEEVLRALE